MELGLKGRRGRGIGREREREREREKGDKCKQLAILEVCDRVGRQMESAWLLRNDAHNLMWSDTSSVLYG